MKGFWQSLPDRAKRLLLFMTDRWRESGHPRDDNGRFTSGSRNAKKAKAKQKRTPKLHPKERAKVEHEINTLYHSRYEGKRCGVMITYNPINGKAYTYLFDIIEFGVYRFTKKGSHKK